MIENIHGDLISERGRNVKFDKKTSISCPSCNPHGVKEDRNLHIRSNIENSVTLECPTCAYTEHKLVSDVPEAMDKMFDIKGRPIK